MQVQPLFTLLTVITDSGILLPMYVLETIFLEIIKIGTLYQLRVKVGHFCDWTSDRNY